MFFTNFCLLGSLYTEDFFNWYMILCNTLLVAKVSFTRLTAKFNKIMYFYLPMQYRLIAIYSYQDVLIMLFETLSGHLVKRFFWWIEELILWRSTEFFWRRPQTSCDSGIKTDVVRKGGGRTAWKQLHQLKHVVLQQAEREKYGRTATDPCSEFPISNLTSLILSAILNSIFSV